MQPYKKLYTYWFSVIIYDKTVELPEDPCEAANFLLTFCHQETLLLHRQIESLKLKHQKEGGLAEELYRKRKEYRGF